MYLGHSPTNAGSFIFLDDIASGFNGSETQFTLQVGGVSITPNTQNLLIALDGIIQQAPDAYTTSGSTITFTGAVPSGTDFYGILMGQSASIGQGTIGADELKISGNGTSGQLIKSDGDGTYSYVNQSAVTADANVLSGTTLKSTVVNSSLTSVGTLSSLTLGGDLLVPQYIKHVGDTDCHIEFGTDEVKLRTGDSSRLIARNSNVELYSPLVATSATFAGTVTSSADMGAGRDTGMNLRSTNSSGYGFAVNFQANDGTDDDRIVARLYSEPNNATTSDFRIATRSGGTLANRLTITSNDTYLSGWAYVNNRVMASTAGGNQDIRVGSHDGNEMLHLLGNGTAKIDTAGTTALTINSSQETTLASRLTLSGDGSGDGIFMGTGWQIFDNASESYGSTGSLVFFNGSQRVEMRENGTMYMAGGFQAGSTLLGTVTISSTQYAVVGSNSSSRGIAICRDGVGSNADFRIEGNGDINIGSQAMVLGTSESGSTERLLRIARFASNSTDLLIGELRFTGSSDGGHAFTGIKTYVHHTNGRGRLEFWVNDASSYAERMSLYYDGNLSIDGSLSSSDVTFKKNVKTITSALDTVNSLRGVTYNWKKSTGKDTETKQYGMIAQEVEELLPELVKDYGDKKKKQLNYTAIIPVLVESIKELSAKVTALEGN